MTDNLPTMGDDYEAELIRSQSIAKAEEPAWLTRLKAEQQELNERGQKLNDFIKSNPGFQKLPARDQFLLNQQLEIMSIFFGILNERVFRAVNPELTARDDAKHKADTAALKAQGMGAVFGGINGNTEH